MNKSTVLQLCDLLWGLSNEVKKEPSSGTPKLKFFGVNSVMGASAVYFLVAIGWRIFKKFEKR